MDERTKRLVRDVRSGKVAPDLRVRAALKRGFADAGLDLSLPHSWGVVQAARGDAADFGSVKQLLSDVCVQDSGLHPFVGGKARPLSFKESVRARLDQWRSEGFGGLWKSWLDTSSAIVYKAKSSKFKIVTPFSAHLLGLSAPFRQEFLSVDYDDFSGRGVVELDANDAVYDNPLPDVDAVVSHPAWLAVMEDDAKLLKQYAQVVFDRLKRPCMAFWLVQNPEKDQLRALCANDIDYYYYCDGFSNLYDFARFARVCPP